MSAACWSEPEPEEVHPGLGHTTIRPHDLAGHRPQEDTAPDFILPTDLRPGDRLRDHGRMRTIARVEYKRAPGPSIVLVVFSDGEDDLAIPPHQHVTVWRPTDLAPAEQDQGPAIGGVHES